MHFDKHVAEGTIELLSVKLGVLTENSSSPHFSMILANMVGSCNCNFLIILILGNLHLSSYDFQPRVELRKIWINFGKLDINMNIWQYDISTSYSSMSNSYLSIVQPVEDHLQDGEGNHADCRSDHQGVAVREGILLLLLDTNWPCQEWVSALDIDI